MKPVEKFSVAYEIARMWVKITFRHLFYRSWKIRGKENIKHGKACIFAANHQNALMDALHLVIMLKAQPIFLARADIFKNKPLTLILNRMKIMPVYRMRDGFDSLQKNDEIFQRCASVLKKGRSIVIFPEGNHGDQRHLRMLKKGLARVAFGAEQATGFELGLDVVPVGIDYTDYEKFRARVTLSIGKPISVARFRKDFEEDPQKGLKALNEAIREEIEPLMIEVPWKDLYGGVMGIRTLYGARFAERQTLGYRQGFDRFDSDKKLIRKIGEAYERDPDTTARVCKKTATYTQLLKRSKLREHVPANAPYSPVRMFLAGLALVIGFPVFLYGLLNHAVIFWIPDKLSRSLIKDRQFISSVAYVLAFVVLLPLMYLLQFVLVWLIFKSGWIALLYLLTLVPSGLFAIHYSFMAKKTLARLLFTRRLKSKDERLLKLLDLRKSLIEELDELIV